MVEVKKAVAITAIAILIANMVWLAISRDVIVFWAVLLGVGLGAVGINKLIDRFGKGGRK